MSLPEYLLTLHPTYYGKGVFNLGVEVSDAVTQEEGPLTLLLGDTRQRLEARVTRRANLNGTPRVHGNAALRDWFQAHFAPMGLVKVTVLDPSTLRLSRDRAEG